MYKLTVKATEYKPGDSIVRKNEAWNLEGETPSNIDEMLSALVLVNLVPPSLARPIDPGVISTHAEIAADRFCEFYGVDDLIMDLTIDGHGSSRLTIEIPPMVSVYNFEPIDENEEFRNKLKKLTNYM